MAERGTTMKTGNRFTNMSRKKRSATSGNKRVVTSNQANMPSTGQKSKVAAVFTQTHKGPYLGKRSV